MGVPKIEEEEPLLVLTKLTERVKE